MRNAMKSIDAVHKWQRVRDSHFRLYNMQFKVDEYRNSMKRYQELIKNYAESKNLELTEAIIELSINEDNPLLRVKLLSAGYDLVNGDDYTQ